jgi:transcriptional regulator with AAA-type ATPase domain
LAKHRPGNVRELERLIKKLTAFCGKWIFPEDVLEHLKIANGPTEDWVDRALLEMIKARWPTSLPTMQQIKNRAVVLTYRLLGHEYKAAKALGIDYRTVNTILEQEGVKRNPNEDTQ